MTKDKDELLDIFENKFRLGSKRLSLPFRLLVLLALSIFFVEFFIMALLSYFPQLEKLQLMLIDSLLLVTLTFPFLYFLFLVPLKKQNQVLEVLVDKRTEELTRTNKDLQITIGEQRLVEEELRGSEESLRESEKKLRILTRKLISVQEEERASVSRNLHDQMGRMLTTLNIETEWLIGKEEVQGKDLEKLSELTRMTTKEMRRICKGLRPLELDDIGLKAAITTLANEFADHSGIEIECSIDFSETEAENSEAAISIYRIIQESLTNIARHAKADSVTILITEVNGNYELVIEDNGKGFSQEIGKIEDKFGLIGMRERAALCGAELDIRSEPDRGTTIIMRGPLNK